MIDFPGGWLGSHIEPQTRVGGWGGWPRSQVETQPRVPHLRRSLIAAKVGLRAGTREPLPPTST